MKPALPHCLDRLSLSSTAPSTPLSMQAVAISRMEQSPNSTTRQRSSYHIYTHACAVTTADQDDLRRRVLPRRPQHSTPARTETLLLSRTTVIIQYTHLPGRSLVIHKNDRATGVPTASFASHLSRQRQTTLLCLTETSDARSCRATSRSRLLVRSGLARLVRAKTPCEHVE